MMRVFYFAVFGMKVQQINVDIIFNNFVNVNIIVFKKDKVEFKDFLYEIFF